MRSLIMLLESRQRISALGLRFSLIVVSEILRCSYGHEEVLLRAVQPHSEYFESSKRGVDDFPFEIADISLREPAALGQLVLREAPRITEPLEVHCEPPKECGAGVALLTHGRSERGFQER